MSGKGKCTVEKKTILVLTGSPRQGGNSDMMAAAFIEGAQGVGHEILRFDAGRAQVSGCRACDACWSKGRACVFDDDFTELAELYAKADVLVLVTPLYWFTFSSQIKAAIDKLYAFLRPNCPAPLKIKESVLIVCAHDTDEDVFDGIERTYYKFVHYLKLKDRGSLGVRGLTGKGDLVTTGAMEKARNMGRTI